MNPTKVIEQLATEACIGLFENYGLPLALAADVHEHHHPIHLCAAIGFGGAELRGTVLLAMSDAVLSATRPNGAGSTRDWAAELVNQLCGRLKTRLLRRDVEVHLALPTVLRGDNIAPVPRGHEYLPAVLVAEGAEVRLWVDVECVPGLELSETEGNQDDILEEGDAMLF